MRGPAASTLPGAVRRRAPGFAWAASLLVLAAAAWQAPAAAQQPQGAAVQRPQPNRPASPRADTRPAWAELTGDQQQALRPLAGQWPTLSEAQKRKWIALSSNYRALPPAEQAKLHSRMTDWVALSPQQRTQARLNFAETKALSPDDKKAKWEAYQALSAEEKRKLAAGAAGKTPPTAAAVRPVPSQRLAPIPRGTAENKAPRIAAGPAEPAQRHQPATHPAPAPQAN